MSNLFGYRVSLRITHPTLCAGAIAASLGMAPEFSWTAGEARTTPRGTLLEGVHRDSYCSFHLGSGDDGQLARCLDVCLTELAGAATFLTEMRKTGGSLMFYAFWHPNGDTGEVFGTDLMRRMADLGIVLGINVYDDRQQG